MSGRKDHCTVALTEEAYHYVTNRAKIEKTNRKEIVSEMVFNVGQDKTTILQLKVGLIVAFFTGMMMGVCVGALI